MELNREQGETISILAVDFQRLYSYYFQQNITKTPAKMATETREM